MKFKPILFTSFALISSCVLSSCQKEISEKELEEIIISYGSDYDKYTGSTNEELLYQGYGELYENNKDKAYNIVYDVNAAIYLDAFYKPYKEKYVTSYGIFVENDLVTLTGSYDHEDEEYIYEEGFSAKFDKVGLLTTLRKVVNTYTKDYKEKMTMTVINAYTWSEKA